MKWRIGLVDGILVLAIAGLVGWPLVSVVRHALAEGGPIAGGALIDLALVGTSGRSLGLAWTTAKVVGVAEVVALGLGVPLAMLVFRTDLPGRRLILSLMGMALFIPLPLHATAWLGTIGSAGRSQLMGDQPLLTGVVGAGFVHGMAALPFVVFLCGVAFRGVERVLEETARLDVPAWRVGLGVTLRRGAWGVVAGGMLVAIQVAGDMTVTDLLQVRTYAEEAYLQAQLGAGPTAAARTAVPPIVLLGIPVVWLLERGRRGGRLGVRGGRAEPWRLGGWRWVLGLGVNGVVGFLMGLPIVGLIWRAGRVAGVAARGEGPSWSAGGLVGTLRRAAPDLTEPSALAGGLGLGPGFDRILSPLGWTILWATVAAALATGLAWWLAWRGRESGWIRWLALGTLALTLAVPGPVAGMALKLGYLKVPVIHDTAAILVLAYVVRILPYALLVLLPAVGAIPGVYVESARVDGLGELGQAWRVGWPLSGAARGAAFGVGLILALGELPASNIVIPPGQATLALRLWGLLHTGVESHLAGVGLLLLVLYGGASALIVWGLAKRGV